MNENTVWAFFYLCAVAVLLSIVGGITYYYVRNLEMKERLISEYGVNPMLIECMNKDLTVSSYFTLCSKVVDQYNLSESDMKKLRKIIQGD